MPYLEQSAVQQRLGVERVSPNEYQNGPVAPSTGISLNDASLALKMLLYPSDDSLTLRTAKFFPGTWVGARSDAHEDTGEDVWFALRAPINEGPGGIKLNNPEADNVSLCSRQETAVQF